MSKPRLLDAIPSVAWLARLRSNLSRAVRGYGGCDSTMAFSPSLIEAADDVLHVGRRAILMVLPLLRIGALAENLQGFLAQAIRIALATFSELDDALGDHCVGSVAPCSGDSPASQLKRNTHNPGGLWIEPLAVEEWRDWHGRAALVG